MTSLIAWLAAVLLLGGGCQTMTGRSVGQWVDDRAITARVKARLAATDVPLLTRVHVDTYGGMVYLTGGVDSLELKRRAEHAARGVPAVRLVVNNLHVGNDRIVTEGPAVAASPRTEVMPVSWPVRSSSAPVVEGLARLELESGTPAWTSYAGYDHAGQRVATVLSVATADLMGRGVPDLPATAELERIDLRPDAGGARALVVLWHRVGGRNDPTPEPVMGADRQR